MTTFTAAWTNDIRSIAAAPIRANLHAVTKDVVGALGIVLQEAAATQWATSIFCALHAVVTLCAVRLELALELAVAELAPAFERRRAECAVLSRYTFTLIWSLAVFAEANTAITRVEAAAVHRCTRDAPAWIAPWVTARRTLFEAVTKSFVVADIVPGEVHTLACACQTFIPSTIESITTIFWTSLAIASPTLIELRTGIVV